MSFGSHFRDALRLLSWRRPLDANAALSPAAILAIGAGLIGLDVAVQWAAAGKNVHFQMYGVNAELAMLAIGFAVVAWFARADRTGVTLRNLTLLAAASCTLAPLLWLAISYLSGSVTEGIWASTIGLIGFALPLFLIALMAGGARQVFRFAEAVRHPALLGVAFAACFWLAEAAMPNWPMLLGDGFDRRSANYWEFAAWVRRAAAAPARDGEARARDESERRQAMIEAAQPARLDAALARLEPRTPRKSNIFVVGVAGWSEQDVFQRETKQSLDNLKDRMGVGNRTIALVNNSAGSDAPVANIQNLAYVLRGVASRMNLEKDVLILTMTSHGSPSGFALDFDSIVGRTLQPQVLKSLLDSAGIKNRVIIVSSCYSGKFLPALADERTMIITAASATKTSFGCANDRNWTYFGEAFFEHGLREERSLSGAFDKAKALIAKWEQEQHLTPSEPQIFVGGELRRRFASLIGTKATAQAWMASTSRAIAGASDAPARE